MTSATYTDARGPLVPGQPEQREYRCQAYEDNQRVWPVSPVVSVVTNPFQAAFCSSADSAISYSSRIAKMLGMIPKNASTKSESR